MGKELTAIINDQTYDLPEQCDAILSSMLEKLQSGSCSLVLPACSATENSMKNSGHFHREPELFVLIKGGAAVNFCPENIELDSGNILFIPSLRPHWTSVFKADQLFTALIVRPVGQNVYFQLANPLFSDSRRADMFKDFFVGVKEDMFSAEGCRLDYRYFETLLLEHNEDSKSAEMVRQSIMILYLSQLREMLRDRQPANSGHSAYVRTALRGISTHYSNPALNVKTLASECNCTPNYLSALFNKEVGVTLTEYLNNIRLENGAEMLRSTTLTISEIAFHTGYESSNYFIRLFKKKYGTTPGAFRQLSK